MIQWGIEAKLPYVDGVARTCRARTRGRPRCRRAISADLVSYQHPDHDTDQWPAGGTIMTDTVRTGGCQCGAVRFRIHGALGRPSHLPLPHVPEGSSARSSRRW